MTLLATLMLCIMSSAQGTWNATSRFHELFRYKVQGKGKASYLTVEPDSMQADPVLRERCEALYYAYDYLYNNYSKLYKHQKEILALRKDKKAMRQQFAERMAEDTAFQRLYLRAVNREMVAPLPIDSALRIAAHFYYVHMMDGRPTVHICIGINKVKDLSSALAHPYHAAFCYMAIRMMKDPSAPYTLVRGTFAEEVKAGVSNSRLAEIEQEVYKRIAELPELRQVLIDTYERHKEHLNFKLVY
ncbi:MAG: hypothetical protein JNL52_16065 [Flavobacteriales bacterium]|nr:hypothetical protein [Flavobacteriales bacterium]